MNRVRDAQQSVTALPFREAVTQETVQVRPLQFAPPLFPSVSLAKDSSVLLILSKNQLLASLIFLCYFSIVYFLNYVLESF